MYSQIERYLRYLEIEKNASKHTIAAYRTDLLQFADFCSKDTGTDQPDIELIKRITIRVWLGELSESGISKSSISRKIAAIRSFFKYCFKRGLITTNPAHLLMPPKKGKRLPKVVPENDLRTMFDLIDTEHADGKQDMAIMELFYSTGIRLSELVQLNVQNVDLSNRHIKVLGKGNKERIIPFGKTAAKALKAHLESRNTLLSSTTSAEDRKAMFLSKSGARIYPRAVQRLVKKYLTLATEVTQKSPHVLRHSFATHLLNNGAEIRVIKEMLGHANLAATQIYTGTSMDHLKNIYDKAHPRAE